MSIFTLYLFILREKNMIISRRSFVFILSLLFASSLFAQEAKPSLKVGGALRYNYNLSSWKKEQVNRGGDFGFDTFIINAKAEYKGLKLVADYRFYTKEFGGHFLKKGWFEYDLSPKHNLQLGLTQVPFGIGEYNSYSYFLSLNYYLGLEDDYDMGIKYGYKGTHWDIDLAFFKNAEELLFGDKSDISASRYSYDISSIALNGQSQRNKEVNQLNARFVYKLNKGQAKHRFGFSAQYGGIYDLNKEELGSQTALAGHYELNYGKFNAKLQASYYHYDALSYMLGYDNQIAMAAFGSPYLVANKGMTYTLGLSYAIPVKSKLLSEVKLYNEFGFLDKADSQFEDTFMDVLGVQLIAGNMYILFDCAMGKNQPYFGGDWYTGLGAGRKGAEWETRFNINLGYYF